MQDNNTPLTHDVETWLTEITRKHAHLNRPILSTALNVAKELIDEASSFSFYASFEIVEQLTALKSDTETIASAILYPFFDNSEKARLMINKKLGAVIYKLLLGTKRMETIDKLPIQHGTVMFKPKQLDNLRKMLLAIVDDVRIVLIKLAERIYTLKNLRSAPPITQQEIAHQSMVLYAPLANRLGIGQFKWQLEDWSFRYLNNQAYSKISKALKQRRTDREIYIEKVNHEIIQLLKLSHIDKYEISGRAKHIFSIHKKCERKQVPLEQIYDSNAFRILVPKVEDCYNLLSVFHEKYNNVPEEFDDYIAKAKQNGYRSIHTVIIGPEKRNIEIQLRTFDMHAEAELGVCAHWRYKESGRVEQSYENKIELLRDIIAWQQEVKQSTQDRSMLYQKLFEDRVYVFTPQNDILDLPLGATPLDAAYAIHTEIGHRCKGAKLNGKMVPLTEKIKTGDVVELLIGKESTPSRDWLNPERGYLTSLSAINKVKGWFRKGFRDQKIAKGLEIWEKAAKREGLNKNNLSQVLEYFNAGTVDDLLISIGLGHTPAQTIIRKLKPATDNKEETLSHALIQKHSPATQVQLANTQNFLTQLARCCNPVPGDTIKGYITKGRGITIHRIDCQNFLAASHAFPERTLSINWETNVEQKYPINITILAVEREGLVRDISTLIANEHLHLIRINSHIIAENNQCVINITIELENLDSLARTLSQLHQLPDVIKAHRKN